VVARDGAFLDYSNPDALQWWQKQEQVFLISVLTAGSSMAVRIISICFFCHLSLQTLFTSVLCISADPYLVELLTPISFRGYMTLKEYQVWAVNVILQY